MELFGASPFDAIRRTDESGEYWSARDLMPLMDYSRWDAFLAVIEKTGAALGLVEGRQAVAQNFRQMAKVSGARGPAGVDYRLTRFAAEEQLAIASPKVEAYDTFMTADGDYAMGAVAQMLGMGQNTLFARLRDEHILIAGGKRHNTPQQQYLRHFRVASRTYTDDDGGSHASYTTYVKPSGVDWIRKVLKMTALT
jgi:phage antirepressor YoqD-like protein